MNFAGAQSSELSFDLESVLSRSLDESHFRGEGGLGSSLLGASSDVKGHVSREKKSHELFFRFDLDIKYKPKRLADHELTPFGEQIMQTVPMHYYGSYWLWPYFQEQCGDALVDAVLEGGKIEIDIILSSKHSSFSSRIDKTFVIKVLFKKIKKTVTTSTQRIEADDHITIHARQVGGDEDGFRKRFVEQTTCKLETPEQCQEWIASVIDYCSSDNPQDFRAQIKSAPAVIEYGFRKYEDLAVDSLSWQG
jgi:hypothetical protein